MEAASPWMNATQAAAYLQRGRRFVLREASAGRLQAARIGGRGEILTRREWLDEWVEKQTAPIVINRRRRAA